MIEAVAREGIPTSVDTWTPEVARAAAEAGVHLLNDVSGFTAPAMVAVAVSTPSPPARCTCAARRSATTRSTKRTTTSSRGRGFLEERAISLEAAGVTDVWLDPGFAFGKPVGDNARLLAGMPQVVALGRPVLVSASRKGFLGELLGGGNDQYAPRILEATLAFNTLAAWHGAHVVRVHDVGPVVAALRVVDAVREQSRER